MNVQKKRPSRKLSCRNEQANQQQRETETIHDLSLAEILRELTPSIEDFLEKSAENQRKMVAADVQFAESVSRIADHLISKKPNIHLNLYPAPFRKKSKKSGDTHHQKVKKIIQRMRKRLKTYDEIAQFLEKENIPTFTKRGRWHAQTVHRLFQEYPES
ncbi:MAG: hypothetical protein C4522_17800 [Desulfobacteraceae bacterium]|nr:MAG: hypothetical protein C4522_17800 [Desulfobacteraceae bacterium]